MKSIKHILLVFIFCVSFNAELFSWIDDAWQTRDNSLGISTGVIFPADKLGEMSEPGPGGVVSCRHSDLFLKNLSFGAESGFFYLKGKATSDDAELEVDRVFIVPVLLTTEYNIPVTRSFNIFPSISLGTAYFDFTYSPQDENNSNAEEGDSKFWDPVVKAGIGMKYNFTRIYIGITADYGVFVETDDMSGFYGGNLIFGFRY